MKYVIFNTEIGNYLNVSGKAFLAVTPDKEALQFKSVITASKFLKNFNEEYRNHLVIRDLNEKDVDFSTLTSLAGNEQNIYDSMLDFYNALGNITGLLSILTQQLSTLDGSTQDILHKIEFDYLFPEEKIDLINRLHNIRQERRIVKDKIAKLEIVNRCKGQMATAKKEYDEIIKNNTNREYTPRVLKNLFKEEG